MQKLEDLSEEEIAVISKQISDSFFDYPYQKKDMGLLKYITRREDMFTYINGITAAACKSGLLYTTSMNREGYVFIAGEGIGSIEFFDGLKMISSEKKALGGWKNLNAFVSACFSDGKSIETRMKKARQKFIRIEMLAVRPEYQKKGFMRKMMEFVYEIADAEKVAVILDTDDEDKCKRYEHLGMKLDRIRHCGENFNMYDLIRPVSEK
ncbi:MAG: GNAT family N-acetyltransferase [Treponema sp.]|nr:GNAT family N-acetyltransferase [Treponema sp.]